MLGGEVSGLPAFLFSFCDLLLDVFFEVVLGIVSVMSAYFGEHIRFRVDVHAVGTFSASGSEVKSVLAEVGDELSNLSRHACILLQCYNYVKFFP